MIDFIITGNRMSTAVLLTARSEEAKAHMDKMRFQGYQPYIADHQVIFETRYIRPMVDDLLEQGYTVGTTTDIE